MGRVARKPVVGVSDKMRLKPVSTATETSLKIKISLVASLDMVLSQKRLTKALIRLRDAQAGLHLFFFANLRRQVFSRRGPYVNGGHIIWVCSTSSNTQMGAQWQSDSVLDSRPKGRGFKPHRRHCIVVL